MVRYRDKEWQELSHRKKDETGNVCQRCGRSHGLVLHHLDSDSYNDEDENLIVLCAYCHDKAHYPNSHPKMRWVLCQDCIHYHKDMCRVYAVRRNATRSRRCARFE